MVDDLEPFKNSDSIRTTNIERKTPKIMYMHIYIYINIYIYIYIYVCICMYIYISNLL